MIFAEKRRLFTSAEVCRACGISRTSLFRLEEIGFLTPYRVNSNTGYRYYDLKNITAIGQFQKMQNVGLSKKEIVDVYFERTDSEEFIRSHRQKLELMQRFLDEYEYHHDHDRRVSGSVVKLPAQKCFCSECTFYSMEEAVKHNYLIHEKCVEKGYQLLGSEPLFAVIDKGTVWKDAAVSGISYIFCVPVAPDTPSDPDIRFFPETLAFSIIFFGNYSVIPTLGDKLRAEIEGRNLSPSGPARIIMHIGAYAGAHYKAEDYCYEYAVPINA
ncbi:MAG: MerR family transcriptional regulator [Lachnospiraceae bacterium]|nr:MerR family transcriptional regulator [Lachnospiraceae bacterium]